MINTVNTKKDQLANTYYSIGTGSDVVLVMGSCRAVPYMNYLNEWNNRYGNRFTLNFIDPFGWHWNEKDERVDYAEALEKLKTDERLLSMIKSVRYFIHEHYQNSGMFNCFKKEKNDRNIYYYGLKPEIDICIPNWNDVFVLFGDIVSMDLAVRKKAVQDYNVIGKLSKQLVEEITTIGLKNILKFYEVCEKSDIPEMKEIFKENFKEKRFFWNSNHVTKHFTLAIFKIISEKFLKLETSDDYLEEISKVDMYANNYTYLTKEDIETYGYEWDEELKELRDYL